MLFTIAGLFLLLQVGTPEVAGPPPAPAVSSSTPLAPSALATTVRLAAGEQLEVEVVEPLSSTTSHLGDKFGLRLSMPISRQGEEVVAAGAEGEGEVIDAAPAGMAGRAGKLILAARRLNLNGRWVRIRGLTLLSVGQNRIGLTSAGLLVPYVGLGAMLIKGGNVEIPSGSKYTVKLAEDADIAVKPQRQTSGEVR